MRDEDLGAQPAKLSAPVPHIVAYLGSNAPQTRENVSHSEAVAGVEAKKGSKQEVDHALVSNPGRVAGAEATDQNNGLALLKGKRVAREMGHKDQRYRMSRIGKRCRPVRRSQTTARSSPLAEK